MKQIALNREGLLSSCNSLTLAAVLCVPLLFGSRFTLAAENASVETFNSGPSHTVVAGDTLYKLARTYLDDSAKWREFLRYNDIRNPRRLVPGSELRIPPSTMYATVIFSHGAVSLLDGNSQPKTVEVGDTLTEGATVNVGSNSYLSLRFSDDSIVRVLSDSILKLRKLRESSMGNTKSPKLSRIMQLEHGNLDISVTPLKTTPGRKTKPNTFEIVTPMAVAAVRGTRFDVSASDNGTASGVTKGSVGIRQNIAGKSAKQVTLDAGTGIAVNSDGKLGSVRALLPEPDLAALPDMLEDADYIALNWPELANAANYHIRVASDAGMQTVLMNLESVTPTLKPRGLANGHYVIGIRAADADGVMGFEATHAVDIQANPAYPFYLQPSNMQTVGNSVMLECTGVAAASAYHIQIASDEGFTEDLIEADQLSNCSYNASRLQNGRYFWRVASIAKGGNGELLQGPYSHPAQFEVEESHTGSQKSAVIAYWLDNRPLTFTAQIASDAEFANILQEKILEASQISLEGLPSGIYYLRLEAKDAEGYSGAYSAARMVEIKVIEQAIERTWADKPK